MDGRERARPLTTGETMRKIRTALVLAAVAALPLTLPGPASAAAQVIRGDVNGDKIADEVTLGPAAPSTPTCAITIAYGKSTGGVGAPTTYSYPANQTSQPYCPDMGVVVDLGGDGKPEIVTTGFSWSSASKALLVLRKVNNQVKAVATYPASPSRAPCARSTSPGTACSTCGPPATSRSPCARSTTPPRGR
ncbi:hypothetical protein [Actinokineospora sp. NBRC 105648]|uniref:hypothetical protein n=1 Tax=Actinokineospora sp. NBRC 105648 TaxID=3032206 RepID=UPI0024A05C07|nr:hypothetical protein [Actinokineospora sp. NBRC 105648]GLZ39714.1 hypothetical protein Acsp05_33380 [Actinokineospora sp. NBRC 105648]